MLTAPGTIDDVTAERLKTEWNQNFSRHNLGKLAVLGDGLKYEPMTIPAQDAQLIEQLKWTVEDVARAFSMPLYKIGAGAMPTNNNVQSLQPAVLQRLPAGPDRGDRALPGRRPGGRRRNRTTASSSTSTACCAWTASTYPPVKGGESAVSRSSRTSAWRHWPSATPATIPSLNPPRRPSPLPLIRMRR
jgi:hypothetical protein